MPVKRQGKRAKLSLEERNTRALEGIREDMRYCREVLKGWQEQRDAAEAPEPAPAYEWPAVVKALLTWAPDSVGGAVLAAVRAGGTLEFGTPGARVSLVRVPAEPHSHQPLSDQLAMAGFINAATRGGLNAWYHPYVRWPAA